MKNTIRLIRDRLAYLEGKIKLYTSNIDDMLDVVNLLQLLLILELEHAELTIELHKLLDYSKQKNWEN